MSKHEPYREIPLSPDAEQKLMDRISSQAGSGIDLGVGHLRGSGARRFAIGLQDNFGGPIGDIEDAVERAGVQFGEAGTQRTFLQARRYPPSLEHAGLYPVGDVGADEIDSTRQSVERRRQDNLMDSSNTRFIGFVDAETPGRVRIGAADTKRRVKTGVTFRLPG